MQLNFKYIGGRIYSMISISQLSLYPLHKTIEILPKSVKNLCMLFLGTLLKHSSRKLGYACIIRDHTAPRYTDCRLYPEPLWFPSLYFVSCSPQSSWPHFAVPFSSEMAILIYSLCFLRLWDILFSLGHMCFECTLLFKFFIRFIHFTFCVGVLTTYMSGCHVGAWCHRRSEEGTACSGTVVMGGCEPA